jgi:hypothetical protein
MRSDYKKSLIVIVLVIILFVLMLSRCTPNQSKSLSIQTPTSSPSPNVVDPTQPSDPAESSPMSTDTPSPSASPTVKPSGSPTATPSVKPSAIATKTVSPTPKKSVKPTSSPSEEVIEPETVVKNDNDGDGWPDYIKPTVTFTNITCVVIGDEYLYRYEVNFLGGDNYSLNDGGGFRGFQMKLENGKFWFSYPEPKVIRPDIYNYYKIRSASDRSWTWFRSLRGKNNKSGIWVRSPLTLNALYTGVDDTVRYPDIDYSLCK